MAKREKRKLVGEQVSAELMRNLDYLDEAIKMMKAPRRESGGNQSHKFGVKSYVGMMRPDRYDHYFEAEKPLVYEMDPSGELESFYLQATVLQSLDEVPMVGCISASI
jgi:hypothetical protein